jgi:hypothetical protein
VILLKAILLAMSWAAAAEAEATDASSANANGVSTSVSDSDTSVRDGRKALGSDWSYPWYDSSSDALRPLKVEKPRTTTYSPKYTPSSAPTPMSANGLVYVLAALALAVILFMLVRYFLDRGQREPEVDHARRAGELARIEALPFNLKPSESDLRTMARRAYEAGDYTRAIVYLFSYQLVELDRNHLIELTRGKTNRQYLRDAARRSGIREMLEPSMIAFEDVYFGHRLLSQARFEACWARVDEFTTLAGREVV